MAERDETNRPPGEAEIRTADGDEPQPWGAGAAPPYARWRRRAIWAAGAAIVVAALAIGWPVVETVLPRAFTQIFAGEDESPDAALTALARRIESLESAVARLDGRVAATAATAGAALPRSDAARLGTRIEALETRPAPRPAPPDRRIAPLAERVQALAGRLDALERRAASAAAPSGQGGGAAPTGNGRLAVSLGHLVERIARLEAALETAADPELASKVESAGARVAGIEAELERLAEAERGRKGDALLLAVGQLREAAAGPRPFDAELRLMLQAAGGDAAIADAAAPLAPLAAKGVPTRTALERSFAGLAARAAQAALAPEDGDWLDRTASRLSRVVTIRRVGEGVEDGEDALSVVARAESRLAAGDLAAAAEALDALDAAPAKVFGEWREAAAARAAVDAAVARLSRRAIERFAAAGGGG